MDQYLKKLYTSLLTKRKVSTYSGDSQGYQVTKLTADKGYVYEFMKKGGEVTYVYGVTITFNKLWENGCDQEHSVPLTKILHEQ